MRSTQALSYTQLTTINRSDNSTALPATPAIASLITYDPSRLNPVKLTPSTSCLPPLSPVPALEPIAAETAERAFTHGAQKRFLVLVSPAQRTDTTRSGQRDIGG